MELQASLVVQWLKLCTPNAGGLHSIPSQRTRSHRLQWKRSFTPQWRSKIPCAVTKTWCSQINKYFSKKNSSFYCKGMHAWSVASVVSDPLQPMDCSRQTFLSMGIVQARILQWVAMPFSRGSSRPRDRTYVSCIEGRFFTDEPLGKPLLQGMQVQSPVGELKSHILCSEAKQNKTKQKVGSESLPLKFGLDWVTPNKQNTAEAMCIFWGEVMRESAGSPSLSSSWLTCSVVKRAARGVTQAALWEEARVVRKWGFLPIAVWASHLGKGSSDPSQAFRWQQPNYRLSTTTAWLNRS